MCSLSRLFSNACLRPSGDETSMLITFGLTSFVDLYNFQVKELELDSCFKLIML